MGKQKVIIKNSALSELTGIVVKSEPNLVAENIKKGVDILGVIGTYDGGDSPTPGLTSFSLEQTINGIVIDPTVDNIDVEGQTMSLADYVNSFEADKMMPLMELSTSSSDDDDYLQVLVGQAKGLLTILLINDFSQQNLKLVYFNATEQDISLNGLVIEPGFSSCSVEGGQVSALTKISALTTISYDNSETKTPNSEGSTIAAEFAPLNGAVLGAIEAEPKPISLTAFEEGQYADGFVLNPTVRPFGYEDTTLYPTYNDAMLAFCQAIMPNPQSTNPTKYIQFNNSTAIDERGVVISYSSIESGGITYSAYGIGIGFSKYSEDFAVYNTGEMPLPSGGILSPGWYTGHSMTPITTTTSFSMIYSRKVTNVEDGLISRLNGVVFGAQVSTAPAVYDMDVYITGGTNSGDSTIEESGTATIVMQPDVDRVLPETVTQDNVTGVTYNDDYDNSNGTFTVSNPTGDIEIRCTCPEEPDPGVLTPFAKDQYVSSVKIAVTKDTADLDQFLASFVVPELPDDPWSTLFATANQYCNATVVKSFSSSGVMFEVPVLALMIVSSDDSQSRYLYSTSEQRSLTSPQFLVHKGWSTVDPSTVPVKDEYYGESVTADVEVSLYATDVVTSYNEKCDPINGKYFGAILA